MSRVISLFAIAYFAACVVTPAPQQPQPTGAGQPGGVAVSSGADPGVVAGSTVVVASAGAQTCPPGTVCNWRCDGGNCPFACPAGATCNVQCDGGNCQLQCANGAVCNAACDGGNCMYQCDGGATCNYDCDGGNCAMPCGPGAHCSMKCDGGNCR